jgi:hypothetical protein
MVDGSYSQFKATKGRKEDRDFKKKGRFDKKKYQFDSSDPGAFSRDTQFTPEEIESTKKRMRDKLRKDKRRELAIVVVTLIALSLLIIWII